MKISALFLILSCLASLNVIASVSCKSAPKAIQAMKADEFSVLRQLEYRAFYDVQEVVLQVEGGVKTGLILSPKDSGLPPEASKMLIKLVGELPNVVQFNPSLEKIVPGIGPKPFLFSEGEYTLKSLKDAVSMLEADINKMAYLNQAMALFENSPSSATIVLHKLIDQSYLSPQNRKLPKGMMVSTLNFTRKEMRDLNRVLMERLETHNFTRFKGVPEIEDVKLNVADAKPGFWGIRGARTLNSALARLIANPYVLFGLGVSIFQLAENPNPVLIGLFAVSAVGNYFRYSLNKEALNDAAWDYSLAKAVKDKLRSSNDESVVVFVPRSLSSRQKEILSSEGLDVGTGE